MARRTGASCGTEAEARPVKTAPKPVREKPKRLSNREREELEGMELAILRAEAVVASCEGKVQAAGSSADHVRLKEACTELQQAQEAVERLYALVGAGSEGKVIVMSSLRTGWLQRL